MANSNLAEDCYDELTKIPLYQVTKRKAVIACSLNKARDGLVADLIKFRDDTINDRDLAANPPQYLNAEDYSSYIGKEIALDEVVYKLNILIQELSNET